MKTTSNLTVTLPHNLVAQLRYTAKSLGIPVSRLVERLLESGRWDEVAHDSDR